MQNTKQRKNLLMVPRVLWVVFTFTLFNFILIVSLNSSAPQKPFDKSLIGVFACVALVEMLLSVALRKILFSDGNVRKAMEKAVLDGGDDLPSSLLRKVLDAQFVSVVVSLAIHETIGILGFTLSILSGDSAYVVPFVVVAFILNLPLWPREGYLLKRMRKAAPEIFRQHFPMADV
ncbi:MAG: hypothetical protein KDD42_09300 [Bdellovibrionales bacterium]|nr:hypothetical protein [Bdellovibrionales bacterium]